MKQTQTSNIDSVNNAEPVEIEVIQDADAEQSDANSMYVIINNHDICT